MKKLATFLAFFCLAGAAFGQVAKGTITAQTTDCTVTNSCIILPLPNGSGAATITLSGTWSATVQLEAQTADNLGNGIWTAISMTPFGGGSTVSSATANNAWQVNVAGMLAIRVRCSAFTSGTIQVFIQSSIASARASPGTATALAIASGTATINPGLLATVTCSSTIDGGPATGVLSTDTIIATPSVDLSTITGYSGIATGAAYIINWPTANHVNFKVCNSTSAGITPASFVMNWKVHR
jgi:hypothetical protein